MSTADRAHGVARWTGRARVAVTIAVLVLALVALAGCSALAGNDDAEFISTAESHYAAAQTAVGDATTAIEGASGDDAAAAIGKAEDALRTGRDEIAAARVAIEQIEDSQGKTDYLASLDAATQALDGLEDLLGYLNTANDLTGKMQEASDVASEAHDDLNNAISSGNSEKYSTMKKQATAARDGFDKAAEMFRAAHELDTSAGLDKAAEYADKRKAQAVVVIRMAGEGKANKTSAYNKSIDEMNKLGKAAEKIGEPAIVSEETWVEDRLSSLTDSVVAAGAKADDLHAKAATALGLN